MESHPQHRADWTPNQVRGALRQRGLTLKRVSEEAGYQENAAVSALHRFTWPAVKRIIAQRLGLPPQQIWPSIFDDDGNVRPESDKRRKPHAERLKQPPEPGKGAA